MYGAPMKSVYSDDSLNSLVEGGLFLGWGWWGWVGVWVGGAGGGRGLWYLSLIVFSIVGFE